MDEETSAQFHERYNRMHRLRRHTIGRPDLLVHGGPIPNLASKILLAHQLSSLEPSILPNHLVNLQEMQQYGADRVSNNDDECYLQLPKQTNYQKNVYSTSYNGLSRYSPSTDTPSDVHDGQQQNKYLLSPPVSYNSRELISKQKDIRITILICLL